jgi:hypothetical protein
MATIATTKKSGPIVLAGPRNGVTVIPSPTPLTRLNYFDGKFLRAQDLQDEQNYLRALVRLSNQAGGHGVAHGYDVTQAGGDSVKVGQGLAINADGQVILLPAAVTLDVSDLIEQTRQLAVTSLGARRDLAEFGDCIVATDAGPGQVLESADLYVITIAPGEALCGEEDVYGKLCEEACVTSTDRPYRIEGVIFRARPLQLRRPLPISQAFPFDQKHLRSRVASAYFEGERDRIASHISKAGLESAVWCLGAQGDAGAEVPIGVVSHAGGAIGFLDTWIVRRERIDTVAKRYWQWRMAMRPWDVYLAHILQFQCQLHDLFRPATDGGDDPCRDSNVLVKEASDRVSAFATYYEKASARLIAAGVEGIAGGLGEITAFQKKLADRVRVIALPQLNRRLLRGGIVELPSAGYLPVIPGSGATINTQVRRWMGEGVDLRFCVVRPDYVPHALEEAQHMDRISLTAGLDNPQAKPQVDILVPNGEIIQTERRSPGKGYQALVQFGTRSTGLSTRAAAAATFNMQGAARTELLTSGGAAVYTAAAMQSAVSATKLVAALSTVGRASDAAHVAAFSSLADDAVDAPVGGVKQNAALFSRLTTLAGDALKFTTARRAAEAAGTTPTAGAFQPAQAANDRTAAIWAQAAIDGNPFTLDAGDTTPVDVRLSIVMPAAQSSLLDLRLRGDFRVDQPAVISGNKRTVKGTISAQLSLRTDQTVNSNVDLPTTATADLVARTVEVNARISERLELILTTTWRDQPQIVDSEILYRVQVSDSQTVTISLLRSRFTEDDEVLEPGNASHSAALSALEVIGAAIGDVRFADAAGKLLFPPPPAPTEDLLVRGTLDWVLFHRRRTKKCADAPERVTVAARRYHVFHLRVPSTESLAMVRKALLENDVPVIERLGFAPVGTVEFGAGVPSLNTPGAVVLADWNSVNPGLQAIYGAIASQGAAVSDGNSLAVARVGRYQAAIASVSAPHPNALYETIPVVPGPLSASGVDGSIAMVTLEPEVRTVCHTVLRTLTRVEQVVKTIQTFGVPGAIERQEATLLGTVTFQEHTATVQGNGIETIKTAWTAQGGGAVFDAAFVSTEGDASETAAARASQAAAIVAGLGGTVQAQVATSPIPLGVDCTTVTVIRAADAPPAPTVSTRTGRAFVWAPQATGAGRSLLAMRGPVNVVFDSDSKQDEFNATELAVLRAFGTQIAGIEFFTREPNPDTNTESRMKSHSERLREANLLSANPSAKSGPLTQADASLLPADAGNVQDIIFLRLAPSSPIGSPQRRRRREE